MKLSKPTIACFTRDYHKLTETVVTITHTPYKITILPLLINIPLLLLPLLLLLPRRNKRIFPLLQVPTLTQQVLLLQLHLLVLLIPVLYILILEQQLHPHLFSILLHSSNICSITLPPPNYSSPFLPLHPIHKRTIHLLLLK